MRGRSGDRSTSASITSVCGPRTSQRDAAALEAKGWGIEATLASRDTDGVNGFTYQRSELGVRIELVPTATKPAFENWFSGGEFALPTG